MHTRGYVTSIRKTFIKCGASPPTSTPTSHHTASHHARRRRSPPTFPPPEAAKQKGDKFSKSFSCDIWGGGRTVRPHVGGVSIRDRNGAPSRKGWRRQSLNDCSRASDRGVRPTHPAPPFALMQQDPHPLGNKPFV